MLRSSRIRLNHVRFPSLPFPSLLCIYIYLSYNRAVEVIDFGSSLISIRPNARVGLSPRTFLPNLHRISECRTLPEINSSLEILPVHPVAYGPEMKLHPVAELRRAGTAEATRLRTLTNIISYLNPRANMQEADGSFG